MTTIYLKKRGDYLVPSLPDDLKKLERIKFGEVIQVEFKKPRNGAFHRKFFALLEIILRHGHLDPYNKVEFLNIEQVLHVVKIKLGHFDLIVGADGQEFYITKSISFSKMDEIEFGEFYSQTIQICLDHFLLNWENEDVERAIEEVARF